MNQGEFLALGIALYMAYSPVKRIGAIQNQLKMLEAPLERLEAILYADESVASPANSTVPMPQPLAWRKLPSKAWISPTSRASPSSPTYQCPRIEAGQSVGLVGQSGAGKSTFVNLVPPPLRPGARDVSSSTVSIVRELDLNELREQIAYVPQMPLLFNTSVAENIRIGKPEASEEEILEAARQANALDFIDSLPNGLETVLSERGNSLSGGQRQRIAIARAFLKNAPILVLDEATSALDNQSDQLIQEALVRLAEDRTTLIIAHRMGTLKDVERRLYFEAGKIAGDGKHVDLLESVSWVCKTSELRNCSCISILDLIDKKYYIQ